jgi:hypothetical protein
LTGIGQLFGSHKYRFARMIDDVITKDTGFGRQRGVLLQNALHGEAGLVVLHFFFPCALKRHDKKFAINERNI